LSKEKIVVDKSIEKNEFSVTYRVKFNDGKEWKHTEDKRLKSAARITRRKEFIKNAEKGDKIKEEDFEAMENE
jgi:hypothetical protein